MVAGVLEGAEKVDITRAQQLEQGPRDGTVIHTRQHDERPIVKVGLSWRVANRAVIAALEDHFTTYGHGGEFAYTPPGGSEAKYIYERPSLRYRMRDAQHYECSVGILAALTQDT